MTPSVAFAPAPAQAVSPDASADRRRTDVRNPDTIDAGDADMRRAVGQAIDRTIRALGWTSKDAARELAVDDAELGKWLSGARRPQFDRLFAHPRLQFPLLLSLAVLVDDVEVVTEIRKRQSGLVIGGRR